MNKRVFFCADIKFPRGDAGANRVLGLANVLASSGYEVIVLSKGERNSNNYNKSENKYYYNGIEYDNIQFDINLIGRIKNKIASGFYLLKKLKSYDISKDDVFILYGSNALFLTSMIHYLKRNKMNKIIVDVVEWHQSFEFRFGYFDLRFQLNNLCFRYYIKNAGNVIAISRMIYDFFHNQGVNVIQVPLLLTVNKRVVNQSTNKRKFIYPGFPQGKDDFLTIMKGINDLTDKEKESVEFHITGTTSEKIASLLGDESHLLKSLKSLLVFHGWLEYEQLMEIYRQSDFFLCAREETKLNEANFPSKVPELMAYGIIPIVNPVGELKHFLEEGFNSLLYPRCDYRDLSKAIRKSINLSDSDLMDLKNNCIDTTIKNFDCDQWVDRIDDYVKNI